MPSPWIDAVILDGVELDLKRVLASVTVRHGRDGFFDPVQASTATLRLRSVTRKELKRFELGALVQIVDDSGAAVFTGYLSDNAIADDHPDVPPILSVIATGPLATVGVKLVGVNGFPAEIWSARVQRLFDEMGVAGIVYPPLADDPLLAAVPAPVPPDTEPLDGLAALDRMRNDVGAVMYDEPDGRLAVQAYDYRANAELIDVDEAIVRWAPAWQKAFDLQNVVTLSYANGAGTVTVQDDASIARWGVADQGVLDTGLADANLARNRALEILGRSAYPRWSMPQLELTERLAAVAIGDRIRLSSMPAHAPYGDWSPVIEGYTETIEGDAWTQSVALSDPQLSGLSLLWLELPADWLWSTINPETMWREATTLDALAPE